jgi:protocatechuate 3,4-dioxygenase, beta subunit
MKSFSLLFLLIGLQACSQNTKPVSRTHNQSCEGCKAIMESPVPFDRLNNTDTFPDFSEQGPKLLISGIVYRSDGKTPASGVVIYAYHTNQQGIYPTNETLQGWGKRHGYLRGWVRTGEDGRYNFYTLRPAAYPNRTDPAHIHMSVKEPDMLEYWIDDVVFADDPFVNDRYKNRVENAGGNGIITAEKKGEMIIARRDIILGKNIAGYMK